MSIVDGLGIKENYVGNKFLIEDYKDVQKNILKTSDLLRAFDVSSAIVDRVEKVYFDTEDMFFCNIGITININHYSSKNYADLIVRYEGEDKRIRFLSNIPDVFVKKIGKNDNISTHFEYIAGTICELIPNGISVEPLEKVRLIKTVLNIHKKRERTRIINSIGLKIILSFEQCVYENIKHDKVKLNILEIRRDNKNTADNKELVKFIRELQLTEYRLIKTKDCDLFVGQEYLDI